MVARFMLTFDCEGKWGVADCLGPDEQRLLTDVGLAAAYQSIVELLDEFDLTSTFAFVGLFTQSQERFAALARDVEHLSLQAPYLRQALDEIYASNGEGWHGHGVLKSITRARTSHEVALHGVTHVPWTTVGSDFAKAELGLLEQLEGPIAASRTFVFPRNLVAHADLLADHGFVGFRAAPLHRSRVSSLLSELNLFETPQRAISAKDIVPIPSGYFVNWRHGVRKLIPISITVSRASALLRRAAGSDRVVHYWLHPENIATEPGTLTVLRGIVEAAARARDAGICEVLTQSEYCTQISDDDTAVQTLRS